MVELTPTALVVLEELAAKGPMTPLEIRKQMGLPSRTISTALRRLTEKRLCLKIPNLLDMRQSLYAVDPVRMKEMQIDQETKELVANHRVAFIRIQDDAFILKVNDWVKDFAEQWASEINIPFYCLLRPESVSDELAYYLKQAGCFSICMSIEAGHDEVRNPARRAASESEKRYAVPPCARADRAARL